MTLALRKNFARGVLAADINEAVTQIVLNSGHALPTAAGSFPLVIWDHITYPDPADDVNLEIVTASYSGTLNTYDIVRAQEDTAVASHSSQDRVALHFTAQMSIDDLANHTHDHGGLSGLSDDDHSLYHTDGRAVTWLAAGHETTYAHSDIALNTTHRGSSGNDHTYIDQNVTTTGSPTFAGINLSNGNIVNSATPIAGHTIIVAASDSTHKDAVSATYTCDGTADEVEIIAAIGSIGTGGGTVLLLEGTYNLSARITPTTQIKNLLLTGYGAKLVGPGSGSHTAILRFHPIDDHENINIEGFELDVNANVPVGILVGMDRGSVRNCYVHNFKIGASSAGIIFASLAAHNTRDIDIISNTIISTITKLQYGIYVAGTQPSGPIIKNIRIIGNKIYGTRFNGIAVYGNITDVLIDKNIVDTCGHSGIAISPASYVTITNNIVSNVTEAVNEGGEGGIEVEHKSSHFSGTSHHVIVANNIVYNCNFGIFTYNRDDDADDPHDISIIGNNISACTKGVYLHSGTEIVVSNNQYENNTDDFVEEAGVTRFSTDAIKATNYTAANLLTACATNAGGLDFSAASKTLTVEDDAIVSQDYSIDASPTFEGLSIVKANNPYVYLKESGTSGNGQTVAGVFFIGKNSIDQDNTYGFIRADTVEWTDGAEVGQLVFQIPNGSGLTTALTIGSGLLATFAGSIVTTGLTVTDAAILGSNSVVFQPGVDSTTSIQVKNAAGTQVGTWDTTNGRLKIGTGVPTISLDIEDKSGHTSIGGIAIKLTNKTGGNTVAGQLVRASAGTDDAFSTTAADSQEAIGVVLEADIADGSEAWIVKGGIADVLIDAGGCTHGDRMITSATAGSADVWNVGGAVATHFQEIGHCIETRVGAGLARCILHFN